MGKLLFLILACSFSLSSQASEDTLRRSSHPWGIGADGLPPPAMTGGSGVQSNRATTAVRSPVSAPTPSASSGRQTTKEGVTVQGTTRIEAHAKEMTATSVGQGNTSGNRVGAVGGR